MKPAMILIILGCELVLLALLNWKGCGNISNNAVQSDTIIKKHSVMSLTHDTIWRDKPVYIPQPGKIIYQTIPANVDTAAILKDYFAKRPYNSGINDSNISIVVDDTISRNSITSRLIKYRINRPDKVINNTIEKTITKMDDRYYYFIGGLMSFNKFGLGPLINVTHDHINGGIYYDLVNKNGGLTLTYKIR